MPASAPLPDPSAPNAAGVPAFQDAVPPTPRLLLGPLALEAIRRAVQEATAEQPVLETGGKVLGCWCEDGSVLAVLPLEAGPETLASPTRFTPDTPWQQAQYERAVERHPRLRLVLDWHLHPDGPAALSARDLSTFRRLLGPEGWGLSQVVAMVALPPPLASAGSDSIPPAVSWQAHAASAELRHGPVDALRLESSSSDAREDRPTLLAWALRCTPPLGSTPHLCGEVSDTQAPGLECQSVPVQRLGDDDPRIDWLMMTYAELSHPAGLELPAGEAPLFEPCLPVPARLDRKPPPMRSSEPRVYARNAGLLDAGRLVSSCVTFIGLGSVGAPLALLLGQAGVGRFVLLDEDRLSLENLSRHPGDQSELHWRKSDLVRSRLRARDPALWVQCPRLEVLELAHRCALEAAVGESQLLVVSTDEPRANLAAARLALHLGIPALFVGIFAEGAGGEIFVQYPAGHAPDRRGRAEAPPSGQHAAQRPLELTETARAPADDSGVSGCYNCLAGFRARLPPLPRSARAHDYSALRPGATLPPMHALAIDIQHTVSIAARAALEILAPSRRGGQASGSSSGAVGEPPWLLTPQLPLLLVSNGAPVWIFERPFEVIPARLDRRGCALCRGVNPIENGTLRRHS